MHVNYVDKNLFHMHKNEFYVKPHRVRLHLVINRLNIEWDKILFCVFLYSVQKFPHNKAVIYCLHKEC